MQIHVNGEIREVQGDANMPLLWVLREQLHLTGTKFGCGAGLCHACTVHLDGEAVQSCQVSLSDVDLKEVRTIEGLGKDGLHPVQKAWIEHSVPQCGYCQPGMIMALSALLHREPNAKIEAISSEIQNICRCGTYPKIKVALEQIISK